MADRSLLKKFKLRESLTQPVAEPRNVAFRGCPRCMNPLALMRKFTQGMNHVLGRKRSPSDGSQWSPIIEVTEKGGELLVMAALFDLRVTVRIEGDALVLEGECRRENEDRRPAYYHSERSYREFYRMIPLPKGSIRDQAAALFSYGVLEISIPILRVKPKKRKLPFKELPTSKAA